TAGRIRALIRPAAEGTVDERLRQRLRRSGDSGPLREKVTAVAGDIRRPNWGLTANDAIDVFREVDIIIHSAADTSFALSPETGTTNVESVRHLIDLAGRCPRRPLIVYMGTATNVGDVSHRVVSEEDGCQPNRQHHNEYTHSKAIAEDLLRASGLPVLTLRPTIVLSAGLADPVFARQILWCVPLTRVFRALPVDPAALVDLVDVGFVADATVRLLEHPARAHDCYHLSAGPGGAATIGELTQVVNHHYRRRSPLRLSALAGWSRADYRTCISTPLQRRIFSSLRLYLPFVNMNVVFDNARLRADLGGQMPPLRPPHDYLGELVNLIGTKAALREAVLP
ncbi:MAG TPA: SDR family oxidoreductase, partial [Gemmataceae bacterium]|nr:SDR family oxidoreductase [Gemmataceae bacterium]